MTNVDVYQTVNQVTVSPSTTSVVVTTPGPLGPIGPAGPTGPQGPSGANGSFVTYTHTQASASATWIINHNLSCRPSVSIVDSGGNVQIGEVLYNSENQITVTFAASFGGYAYLN